MIERYSRPEMSRLWSDENRIKAMIEVEKEFVAALAKEKGIAESEISVLASLKGPSLVKKSKEIEAKTNHDVVALISAIASELNGKAPNLLRYLHYGLTSSDILDTALALQMRDAVDLLLKGLDSVLAELKSLAKKHAMTWMAGRTHGVHAEPMTLGLKFASWHAEALRGKERLLKAKEAISYGKLSGAVGTFSQIPPTLEAQVCLRLGLNPEPISTQVIPRDRHAEFIQVLVLIAAGIERWATEIRHLQKTETLELEEPFAAGQKGSSAMPHKRNPVLCENLVGLSRLMRSYSQAALEDIALWHERDISHSSVERVILPDACILLDFMLNRFKNVLSGLLVYPERMKENMERSYGLMFSQRVLLSLIDSGMERLKAYEVVQKNAMKCWQTRQPFRSVIAADPVVSKRLSRKDLDRCFNLSDYKDSVEQLLERSGIRTS